MLRWGGGSGGCCRVWEDMEMVLQEESVSEMVGRDIGTAHCFRQEKSSGKAKGKGESSSAGVARVATGFLRRIYSRAVYE